MNQPKNQTQAATIQDPVFDNGNDAARRLTDPTVAIIVTVNLDVKRGTRTLSCNAPLHEIPLLRRMYAAMGGTVTPNPHWLPGLRRRAKLSHSQLQDELRRLARLYVVPAEGGKRDIMSEVYGATASDQLRNLRAKMIEAHDLWKAMESRIMADIRHAVASGTQPEYHRLEAESLIADRLNAKDIDKILRQIDPAEVAADEIELGELKGDDLLAPAGATDAPTTTGQPAEPTNAGGFRDVFAGVGEDDPEDVKHAPTGLPDSDLDPAELTEADVLIANLREDGLEPAQAHQVALIATATAGPERADRIREAGFKGKALAIVSKRLREYDTVAVPAPTKS
jgi:hypothetical protein